MHIDVFNGDADGICALIQLRLAFPCESQLVTGIKRDIKLLERVEAQAGVEVTVLDVSEAKNHAHLLRILDSGASVLYADHHTHSHPPTHPKLTNLIDTDSAICTSLIINRHLGGAYPLWAVVGAFGDNMHGPAVALARQCELDDEQIASLEELGTLVNYNGYGAHLDDLFIPPQALYAELQRFTSPLDYLATSPHSFHRLKHGYADDLAKALLVEPTYHDEYMTVVTLPDAGWSRRISGVFGNLMATEHTAHAHAIITPGKTSDCCTVSLRAPIQNPYFADKVAEQFPNGGGRSRAAGINALPIGEIPRLISAMQQAWGA